MQNNEMSALFFLLSLQVAFCFQTARNECIILAYRYLYKTAKYGNICGREIFISEKVFYKR